MEQVLDALIHEKKYTISFSTYFTSLKDLESVLLKHSFINDIEDYDYDYFFDEVKEIIIDKCGASCKVKISSNPDDTGYLDEDTIIIKLNNWRDISNKIYIDSEVEDTEKLAEYIIKNYISDIISNSQVKNDIRNITVTVSEEELIHFLKNELTSYELLRVDYVNRKLSNSYYDEKTYKSFEEGGVYHKCGEIVDFLKELILQRQ